MEKWIDFYRSFFRSDDETRGFVTECEDLAPPNHTAKIMMHQCQRLVSITDDIPQIRPRRESLRLLFLIMCAENVAKLHAGFQGEGQSRKYVRKFFETFPSDVDKAVLASGFIDHSNYLLSSLGLRGVVDMLYGVRCDVVHEGNYWEFNFHDGATPMINVHPDVESHITFDQFRAIVVRGCINAVRDLL
jgi:hypothetical protein